MFQHEHVSRWHPWNDTPGIRHTLKLWQPGGYESIDELVARVSIGQQYVFCNDILDPLDIPLELLKHEKSEPYMSRTGKVVALRVRSKKSGFFIPSSTWGYKREPDERLLAAIHTVFHLFNYEAITPASLSEKVLRSLLPEKISISRPSHPLRTTILQNHIGGRIDKAKKKFHRKTRGYDEIKAYLYHAEHVPNPFHAPVYHLFSAHAYSGGASAHYHQCDDRYRAYATAFLHCVLTVHECLIHPIQIRDEQTHEMRTPRPGETIERWLWLEEVDDCVRAGYTLEAVYRGYCWSELSDFLLPWSDVLWNTYQEQTDTLVRDILKIMMVGLPGRFLKSPETYTLIHQSDYRRGDMPIIANWKQGQNITTPWFLRAEFDMQSAQLSPIGSYIVMKCRQELYHKMLTEVERGNEVVSSYIDCYHVTEETRQPEMLREEKGAWKQKEEYENVWADGNQMIPEDFEAMRAPGTSGTYRKALYVMYHGKEQT